MIGLGDSCTCSGQGIGRAGASVEDVIIIIYKSGRGNRGLIKVSCVHRVWVTCPGGWPVGIRRRVRCAFKVSRWRVGTIFNVRVGEHRTVVIYWWVQFSVN